MKKLIAIFSLSLVSVYGQLMPSPISEADQKVTNQQAVEIFQTLKAVNFAAKDVVFPIYAGRQRVAYGISLGNERLLTKASELRNFRALYTAVAGEGVTAEVEGIYREHDLAVLKVPGLKAPPVQWGEAGILEEGSFLAAIRPDGEAQAMGVLSVNERSLRTEDQGFLGIQMDPRSVGQGVRVEAVVPESAAALVGIRPGDVVTQIDGEEVRGFYELSTRLRRMTNGEQPKMTLKRGAQALEVQPTLKGREIRENEPARLQRMDTMSGTQSRVRSQFSRVLQSDMELEAADAGLPVVDLEGRVLGMVIAREGRISTLILPGTLVSEVLQSAPEPLEVTIAPQQDEVRAERRGRMQRDPRAVREMMRRLQRELERE